MQDNMYEDIKNYLQTGDIPQNVPSTRANFIPDLLINVC